MQEVILRHSLYEQRLVEFSIMRKNEFLRCNHQLANYLFIKWTIVRTESSLEQARNHDLISEAHNALSPPELRISGSPDHLPEMSHKLETD